MKHCWRGKKFRLMSLTEGAEPKLSSPEVSVFWAAEISGIDASALTYFAASIFWRAAVQNWSIPASEPVINLGPYQEQLRKYLCELAEFPKNCMLAVVLPPHAGKLVKYMMHPFLTRTRGICVYTLLFLGIQFSLYVGRKTPPDWREADFVRGWGNPISVLSRFDDLFVRDIFYLFGKNTRALEMLDQIEDRTSGGTESVKLTELANLFRFR
jgi:hypothetical protein